MRALSPDCNGSRFSAALAPRATRPPLQILFSPQRERQFQSHAHPVLFLLRWKDPPQVPLLPGAQQATLLCGLLRVFVLSPEAFVGSAQLGRLTQPLLQLFAAGARFLFVRLLQAQVFQSRPAAFCFLLCTASALLVFSVRELFVLAFPRLLPRMNAILSPTFTLPPSWT